MVTSKSFEKHYRRLNKEQKRAVDTIEGPVMVIAGPGTGKTQILTLRIANILRNTDTSPDSILALTFTEAGVVAMRKRLVEIIGSDAYRVGIYTFHGFANILINNHPDEYPRIVGASNVNDIDRITILKEIIQSTKLKILKPFGDPFYYIHHILSGISELKRENVSPDNVNKLLQKRKSDYKNIEDTRHVKGPHAGKVKGKYQSIERQLLKDEELIILYRRYEKELKDRRLYDYEDMILETVKALENNENFLLSLEEKFQYILADEHQDANNSQNKILELLSSFHQSPNLFLVGDEKQAIYRFQGASLENFLYFTERHKDAEIINLNDNYRSKQGILNAAHSLITKGELSRHQSKNPQIAHIKGGGDEVDILSFSRPEFEYAHLAVNIKRHIEEGIDPREIAVLYRNNNDVSLIVPALERERVPFIIESNQNALEDLDMKKIIAILYAVHFFGNEERLISVLSVDFLGIPPIDLYKILRFRSNKKISVYDLVRSKVLLKKAGVKKINKVYDLYKNLSSWSIMSKNKSLLESLEIIANKSGFWGHLITHERAQEKLDIYSGLVRDIEQLVENHREYTLKDLIKYFDLLYEHNLLVKRTRRNSRMPSVRLMTVHRAKGLEFDYVYLPRVVDGHWGNKRTIKHFSLSESVKDTNHDPVLDERRLFYVALTRARYGVSISYATEGVDGKELLPSLFIEEIGSQNFSIIETSNFEKKHSPLKLLAPRIPTLMPVTETKYLQELFFEQGFSVTALNNYLRDPWEYFFGNLLRVPKAPTRSMLFGIAMHNAMHDLFERLESGNKIDKAYLLSRFRHSLNKQPLSSTEYEESLEKGEYALSGYYEANKDTFAPTLGNEFSIKIQFPIGDGENITLRGILDKIESVSENEVRVVDYKTGRVRSRNDIMGLTKTSNGDYMRQLVFYKLLLSYYENGKYSMTTGVIDFLEPDKNNKYHKEEFVVTDDDVEELKELIRSSAREILELSFWNSACDPKKSHFCNLQELLKESYS